MPYSKIQFKPGIVRDPTAYSSQGAWYDCNLVRFRLGYPESIGGWQKEYGGESFDGACRSIIRWSSLTGEDLIGFGTTYKYYVERGGGFSNITPLRLVAALGSNPFSISSGSNSLLVTHNSHGATQYSFVSFQFSNSLGGNVTASVLNQEHQISEIVDQNSYRIILPVTANASDTGGGGSAVNAYYQLNVGYNTQVGGPGWGASAWGGPAIFGSVAWGQAASTNTTASLRIWAHDNFGEDLVFCIRNGGIYYFDVTNGYTTPAVPLSSLSGDSSTPTIATQVLVSDRDRHVIAFGANYGGSTSQDPLRIRFSDQLNAFVWTPSATNTAGDLYLGSGTKIVRALETKREILVWTDVSLYSMQFIGPPFTFGIQQISTKITTVGFNAFAAVEDTVFWMGLNGFYTYSGQVEQIPCPVKDYVFSDFNYNQSDKVFAGVDSQFSEVIWFYPSEESEENDKYVIYNYQDNAWYYGSLARTAWLDTGDSQFPLATGADNIFYRHDNGTDDGSTSPSTPLNSYIESAPFELGEGDDSMFIKTIIPDIKFYESTDSPQAQMTLMTQRYPGASYDETLTSNVNRVAQVPVEQFTQRVNVRLRGRQATLKVSSNKVGTRWILGAPRLDMQPDGGR